MVQLSGEAIAGLTTFFAIVYTSLTNDLDPGMNPNAYAC